MNNRRRPLIPFILLLLVCLMYLVFAVVAGVSVPEAMEIFEEDGTYNSEELDLLSTVLYVIVVAIPVICLVFTGGLATAGFVNRRITGRFRVLMTIACVGVLPMLFFLWLLSFFGLLIGVIYLAAIVFFIFFGKY